MTTSLGRRLLMFGAPAAAVAAVGAHAWVESRSIALTFEPAHFVKELKLPERESTFALRADVPLSLIREAANKAILPRYNFSGDGPSATVKLSALEYPEDEVLLHPAGFKLDDLNPLKVIPKVLPFPVQASVGTHYDITLTRGTVSIVGSGDTVSVTVPISLNGWIGFRGDGAKLLKLDKKNVSAQVLVKARARVELKSDWTPELTSSFNFEWLSDPKVEVVGSVWVNIRSLVDDALRKQLKDLPQQLRNSIPADIVRREVAAAWRVYSMRLPSTLPVWAHVVPVAVGTSGLAIDKDYARVGLVLKARTEISTESAPTTALQPLPALTKSLPFPGRLSVVLPVHLNYQKLRSALLTEIGNKPFSTDVAGSKATVTVKDVFVYPSGDHIALGLSFAASIPGRILDVSGKVFLTVKPAVENDGTLVRLTNVAFARQLDNPIWSVLSAVFEGQLKKLIEEKAQVSLAPEIEKKIVELKALLADPAKTQGVRVTVRDAAAGIDAIVPQSAELAALIRMDVGIDTELQSLPMR